MKIPKYKKCVGMMTGKLKITHKIMVIVVSGIMIAGIFATLNKVMGDRQINTLETIYNNNITPLDSLRHIQLGFREIEFYMTGAMSDVVAPIGAGNHLKQTMEDIENDWSALKQVLADSEETHHFEKGLNGFNGLYSKLLPAYYNENIDEVEDIYNEWLDYKSHIIKGIDRLAEKQKLAVKENYDNSRKLIIKVNRIVALVSICIIGVFIVVAVLIVRSIKRPINIVVDAAEQVSGGDLTSAVNIDSDDEMGHMAKRLNKMIGTLRESFRRIVYSVRNMSVDTEGLTDMSKKLLHGAEEQRLKGEQIATTSTEMAQSILEVARNTTEASDATKESFEFAEAGKGIVHEVVASITELAESVGNASRSIDGLGRNLDEIDEIVSVIQNIADQTNLLALNAAIEAARSGEHGRGFAVVADEVRKLAERTASATEEIESKIRVIQGESKTSIAIMERGTALAGESVKKSEEAGEALQKIVESSNRVMDIVQNVAAAAEEQSTSAEEVSQTMEHISMIINDHCALASEVEKSAANLSMLAKEVIEQTSYFHTSENNVADGDQLAEPDPVTTDSYKSVKE